MQALRVLGASLAAAVLLAVAPPPPIRGFGPAANARERVDEARFLDLPSAQGALDHAAVFGAHPHYAGTPADHALALYARDRLREYGFEARIEPFEARVETPRRLALELYADGRVYVPRNGAHRAQGTPPLGLDLREAGNPLDPPTLDPAVGLPFNAGSADGDLVAPLVYAHRGLPEDYAALARAGVAVRGAVVLVRYGAAFRGLLAQAAQSAGAAGAILYDDPADDGAGKGPAYPDGPWRPAASVQRGRLGAGIRIPVLPVSANNARLLLRALRGPSGPAGWAGGLDAPYPLAKGPAVVHLVVAAQPHDHHALEHRRRGARHGARAERRAGRAPRRLGVRRGRQRRGLDRAARSGARAGLPGQQRLAAQAHAGRRAVGRRGDRAARLGRVRARPRGRAAARLRRVPQRRRERHRPEAGRVRRRRAGAGADRGDPGGGRSGPRRRDAARPLARAARRHRRGRPGAAAATTSRSCSASARRSPRWASSGPFGPYHSSYDTVRYATTWSDPGFVLHRTAAQLYGVVAMRLADADALPYAFAAYVPALRSGLLRLQARAQRDGRPLDLAPVWAAIDGFAAAARRGDDAIARGGGPPNERTLAAAQELDRVAYGVNGYASVAYPELDAAYAGRDEAALRTAVGSAAGALARATRLLR